MTIFIIFIFNNFLCYIYDYKELIASLFDFKWVFEFQTVLIELLKY